MASYGTAAPQGSPKAAVAAIDAGLPTGGNPGGTEVILPGRASPIPSNKSKGFK